MGGEFCFHFVLRRLRGPVSVVRTLDPLNDLLLEILNADLKVLSLRVLFNHLFRTFDFELLAVFDELESLLYY